MMIEAVLFDMDGLLIDSEPFWQETEYRIFEELGLELTDEIRKTTYGLPINELIDFYYKIKPWKSESKESIRYRIFNEVEEKIKKYGKPMPGAMSILEFFKNKKLKLALASGSPHGIINAVIEKLQIRNYFSEIHSGDDEEYGKPHPAVYLTTAQRLKVNPSKCLVFEDSLYGLISAKAALMKTVAVPGNGENNNPKFLVADLVIHSLKDFTEKHFELLNSFH